MLSELHGSGDISIQRVIAAHSDVLAGVKLRATLANQYATRGYDLAAIAFDSEPLGF